MSIAPARLAAAYQPTGVGVGVGETCASAANDNDYLYLVDADVYCEHGVHDRHSRSPALSRADRARRPHAQWSRPDLDRTSLVGFHYNYEYDGAGLMMKAHSTSASWRYTPSDNVQDYAGTNELDQYGSVDMGDGSGAQDQVHDAAGNLTSSGAGRTYTYNSENQLIRAQGPGLHMEYWYDSEGRRDRSLDHVANTEVFHQHLGQMHPKGTSSLALGAEVGDYTVCRMELVDGACPATNTIGTGKVIAYTPLFRIILGQNIDERIAYHDVDGDDLSFYLTNHQGSTISMTTETGTQKPYADGGRYVYTPYGSDAHKGTASEVSMSGNPFRYTGRRLDAQTGLYYYRARYYDSEGGRFLQTDPIGTDDQMNVYTYCGSNPMGCTDPSGMKGLVDWWNGRFGVSKKTGNSLRDDSLNFAIAHHAQFLEAYENGEIPENQMDLYVARAQLGYAAAGATPETNGDVTLIVVDVLLTAAPLSIKTRKSSIPGPRNSSFGKLDYLLGNVKYNTDSVGKGGFFSGVMGMSKKQLATALHAHFKAGFNSGVVNAEGILDIIGPMKSPSGRVFTVKSSWKPTKAGHFDLVTAMPAKGK